MATRSCHETAGERRSGEPQLIVLDRAMPDARRAVAAQQAFA
ncbi:hypothetical protein [Streptomyces niveus]